MEFILHPWHVLIFALSASINRERDRVIEYLMVENQVLREKLGKGRILLNDDQRRRLAVKGKFLGRKALSALTTIVTPDTILLTGAIQFIRECHRRQQEGRISEKSRSGLYLQGVQ